MTRRFSFCALLLFACPAIAQISTTGPATTRGMCSPANTGNQNTFNITCGIGKEQGDNMLAILNKILADQLDPNAVMAKLDEIGKDVKKLGHGIYSGYDFNGIKRDQRPGVSVAMAGEEVGVFQTMLGLQNEHKWNELLSVAEGQIRKTPDWLTPYLFSGIAHAQLVQRTEAIERLTFVVDESAGDPAYADAARILSRLRQ